ncbi:ATP-binding protein [Candidatus Micrarchaeota archaeon]|nr:ATP-binding protein [Candidatus Micrarchaeota archaeon]
MRKSYPINTSPAARGGPERKTFTYLKKLTEKNLGDKMFVRLFPDFCTALNHEMRVSLSNLHFLCQDRLPDLIPLIDELLNYQGKIQLLARLTIYDSDIEIPVLRQSFSESELISLGIDINKKAFNLSIGGLKQTSLSILRSFKRAFSELESGIKNSPVIREFNEDLINSAFSTVGIFYSSVSSLINSDFSLTGVLMPVDDAHSGLVKTLRLASIYSGCEYNVVFEERNSLRDIRVNANILFLLMIFKNLFSNAKRATEQMYSSSPVLVTLNLRNDILSVDFTDYGCGIHSSILEKLKNGEQATTFKDDGNHGFGIQISKELAEKMNGRMYIKESALGEGTTVTLELKVV